MRRTVLPFVALSISLIAAATAAAQSADVYVRVHSVAPSAAFSARAIPANVIVPQARAFAANRERPGIEITRVNVGVVIVEQTATTTMDIELRNLLPARTEAELVVPLPDGASVRSFAISGAAKEPTAELLPADAAMTTYKSIVATMKDPAVLEFAGCNLVRSSLFPLEPFGTQKIRLTYEHLLPADGQRVDYVLPRTESIDYRVPWEVSMKIKSKAPLSTIYSPSHAIECRRPDQNTAMVHFGKEAMNEPGSLKLSYLRDGGDMMTASLLAFPDAKIGGGYFLLLAGLPAPKAKPKDRTDERPVRREITLVIDRSGSMNGEKIQQVKAAALQVVQGLEDGEAFNIVDYSDYISSFSPKPVIKNRQNITAACDYIRRLTADGGTNLHDALSEALRPQPSEGMLPIVLFLTDGLPTVGVCDESVIRSDAEKMNVHHRRIFTFGVGYDVNAPLLSHLAQKSRAASTFVLPNEDIESKVSQIFRRLSGPVISDPVLTAVDNGERRRVIDPLPAVLPDLFAGDQLVVLGKYQGDAPLNFRLNGKFHGKPRSLSFSFKLDRATAKNGFVPRLWASRKIAALVEEIRQAGADPRPAYAMNQAKSDPRLKELVDEIVKLSVEFGVLTEYTAFLDKQGTDLSARNAVLQQATQNFVVRAQNTRNGMGAVNQTMNGNASISQSVGNARNGYLDQNMNRVETSNVQQLGNGAMYQRGNTWIDGAVINGNSIGRNDRVVQHGTPEYDRLIDELTAQNRQSALSHSGDILLQVDGKNVLIKGVLPEAGK